MNILVTGAFGNIGESTVQELVKQGHKVRCFDIKTKTNDKTAKKYRGEVEVMWGDVRRLNDVDAALQDQEAVIHLAFIIASDTSITGVSSEADPEWARAINVGGTENVISAARAKSKPPKIIFSSSFNVFGLTQDQTPPRTASDPVCAVSNYTSHKIECEEKVKASGLDWVILRFGLVSPLRAVTSADMFDPPLWNRTEFVHTRDVGLACANAVTCDEASGKILLIGGGPKCQMCYGDFLSQMLETMGVGMLPEEAFGTEQYGMDWLDTAESQTLLKYQRYTAEDYVQEMRSIIGYKRHLARLFRPFVRRWLLSKSPYYKKNR